MSQMGNFQHAYDSGHTATSTNQDMLLKSALVLLRSARDPAPTLFVVKVHKYKIAAFLLRTGAMSIHRTIEQRKSFAAIGRAAYTDLAKLMRGLSDNDSFNVVGPIARKFHIWRAETYAHKATKLAKEQEHLKMHSINPNFYVLYE